MKSFFDKYPLLSTTLVLLIFMLSLFLTRNWLQSIDTIYGNSSSYTFDSDVYINMLYLVILCFWIITCIHISLMQFSNLLMGIIVGLISSVIGAFIVGWGVFVAISTAVFSVIAGVVFFHLCKQSSPLSYFLSLLVASLPLICILLLESKRYSDAIEEMSLINGGVLSGSLVGAFVYLLLITQLDFLPSKRKSEQ